MTEPRDGTIVTFYSYKGGVGRSMALSNIAVLLSQWGYECLIIDWDLEAPGLENFFTRLNGFPETEIRSGILDILISASDGTLGQPLTWEEAVISVPLQTGKYSLDFLASGKKDDYYFKRLKDFDVSRFYRSHNGGKFVDEMREEWKSRYDFVLIDSRTGLSDYGGICTVQLPDLLFMLFSPTEQGLSGTLEISKRAHFARQALPADRAKLLTIPIPSKFDNSEFKLSANWLDRSAERLSEMCSDWLPKGFSVRDFFEITKLPYRSYFGFGERLAVFEENTADPGGLTYAYSTVSAMIARKLEGNEMLLSGRDSFVQGAIKTDYSGNLRPRSSSKKSAATIFVSFASFDDPLEDERMTTLLETLRREIKIQLGMEINLLYKKGNPDWIESWRKWEEGILEELAIFMPVVTPLFFNDEACLSELQKFLEDENKTVRNSVVKPIYYIRTPLASPRNIIAPTRASDLLGTHTYLDWSELRFQPVAIEHLRKELSPFASQLREIIAPGRAESLAANILQIGRGRFEEETSKRKGKLPPQGAWEVCFVIQGDVLKYEANEGFLNLISAVPKYSGWPLWLDSRGFPRNEDRPYRYMGTWESYMGPRNEAEERSFRNTLDFWRADPRGHFYHRRALEDDMCTESFRIQPLTVLDFGIPVYRVAESIAVGMAIAKKMRCILEHSVLTFAFRWSGLENRELSSWAAPARPISPGQLSTEAETGSYIDVPLSADSSTIHEYVHAAVAPLYQNFGIEIGGSVIHELTLESLKKNDSIL